MPPIFFLSAWLAGAVGLYAQDPTAFAQDPLADGVVTIEAEHYHLKTPGAGAAAGIEWVEDARTSASGGLTMQALPDTNDVRVNSGYAGVSPRLDFVVNFSRTGTHYVVGRGEGETSADDSFHVGLDGQEVATSDRITSFSGSMKWSGITMDGNARAEFEVPSAGDHTVNVWMREDGFALDKLVLTVNSNFLPSGLGPPESPRVGDGPAEEEAGPGFFVDGLWWSNGMVGGTFEPMAGAAGYEILTGDAAGAGMWQDAAATVFGFRMETPPGASNEVFYAVRATAMSTNRELAATVLNRLAYGPTPDLLPGVLADPEGYITNQLAPEGLAEGADSNQLIAALGQLLEDGAADLYDLRAWYALRAIAADRQLLEVLTQFFNNHFVTYYWKTRDYFRDEQGLPENEARKVAAALEYRELKRWRAVLLDPDGTFYDLLKVSAESPAMIIYLDTVENDKSAPNENYAREIMELFSMGVDNGYDQSDIEAMAPCWTGWRVGQVHPDDVDDPLAPAFAGDFILPRQDTGWRYRAGTAEPAADWRELNFVEDTNWFTGQTSIGFGDNDDNTVLDDMRYNYSSVYLRRPFVIADPADITQMVFSVYVDDGCIVWINTQEVARVNVNPGVTKAYDDVADASVGNAEWTELTISNAASVLVPGTNILAVHALNRSLNNNDFSIDMEAHKGPLGVWTFVFDPASHYTSNKVIFAGKVVDGRFGAPWAGRDYELDLPARAGTGGLQDGYDIIAHLANLPHTEEFISVKLCNLLVHEGFDVGEYYNISQTTPESELVRACMLAWETPAPGDGRKGNIREVLKVIVGSDLFRSQAAAQQKVKTPFEYVVSAVRALRADVGGGLYTADTDGYDLDTPMDLMGMGLFERFSPDGWPENAAGWIDTGTVTERLRFIQNFMMHPDDPLKTVDYYSDEDDNICDPVALVQSRLPAGDWNDPYAVTDYFIDLIYPGIGDANLDLEREECVQLLDTDATGAPSPFSALAVSGQFGAPYNDRLRSMVGLLLANPRFHEQ